MARAINPSVNPVSPENAIVVSADIRPKSFAEATEDLEKSEYVSFSGAAINPGCLPLWDLEAFHPRSLFNHSIVYSLASSFTLGNPGCLQMVRSARSARVSTQSAQWDGHQARSDGAP